MSELQVHHQPAAGETQPPAFLPALVSETVPAADALPSVRGRRAWLLRLGMVLLLTALLYFALRRAPLYDIWQTLSRLRAWQIAILLGIDALIYALISARWWFVVHAENRVVQFIPLIGVRISVFALSYFTLGPQIGGEPLQVFYLRKRYGLSFTRATASVLMDKLFELLGNFLLLSFGLLAVLQTGVMTGIPWLLGAAVLILFLLMAWPVIHIVLLYKHVYPIASFLNRLGAANRQRKAFRFVRASEYLAGRFCQRHLAPMLGAVLTSLMAAAAAVSEYALITSFLHIHLPFFQLISGWMSGWLSFLVPLPGALGALEASQVSVLGVFGIPAAAALSVTLVIRGRDLIIGGLGLLLAGNEARRS